MSVWIREAVFPKTKVTDVSLLVDSKLLIMFVSCLCFYFPHCSCDPPLKKKTNLWLKTQITSSEIFVYLISFRIECRETTFITLCCSIIGM